MVFESHWSRIYNIVVINISIKPATPNLKYMHVPVVPLLCIAFVPCSIPARCLFCLPYDTNGGRYVRSLIMIRLLHNPSRFIFIIHKFRRDDLCQILPLSMTIIKFTKSIQLIALILSRQTTRPFGKIQASIDNALWEHCFFVSGGNARMERVVVLQQ